MHMVMLVFRSSLKERVHELLRHCHVHAFTEVNETVGYGQTGPAEGLSFYPGTNSVIFVALAEAARDRVAGAVKGWCEEHAQHPGWEKPSIRVFSWPCSQIA
jgi:nitrogen regulatory protein PII